MNTSFRKQSAILMASEAYRERRGVLLQFPAPHWREMPDRFVTDLQLTQFCQRLERDGPLPAVDVQLPADCEEPFQ